MDGLPRIYHDKEDRAFEVRHQTSQEAYMAMGYSAYFSRDAHVLKLASWQLPKTQCTCAISVLSAIIPIRHTGLYRNSLGNRAWLVITPQQQLIQDKESADDHQIFNRPVQNSWIQKWGHSISSRREEGGEVPSENCQPRTSFRLLCDS